jgi:hypothetical protein
MNTEVPAVRHERRIRRPPYPRFERAEHGSFVGKHVRVIPFGIQEHDQ